MQYTKEYFIEKFEAIPEEEIGKGMLKNKCSFYHCGVTLDNRGGKYIHTKESEGLMALLGNEDIIIDINDGNDPMYKGITPKQRILNKLRSL